MNDSQLLDQKQQKNAKALAAAGVGAGALVLGQATHAGAQTYTVTDAVTEVTAVPDALGTVVGGFTVLAVAVMGVTYAVRLGKRIRP